MEFKRSESVNVEIAIKCGNCKRLLEPNDTDIVGFNEPIKGWCEGRYILCQGCNVVNYEYFRNLKW